jgi:hypothetical protein
MNDIEDVRQATRFRDCRVRLGRATASGRGAAFLAAAGFDALF